MKNTKIGAKNKLVLTTVVSIVCYVVVFFILIVIIWKPKNNGAGVSRYDTNIDYYEKMSKVYLGKINMLLNSSNADKLYDVMDREYISSNNLTKDNFKEYLIKKRLIGQTINVYEYTYSEDSNTSVFVYKYRCMGFNRIVNVIETKPYKYTISFEQNSIPGINQVIKADNYGLSITIENTKRTQSQINYKVTIKNNNEHNVGIDLASVYKVSLLMSDGNYVNMVSAYSDVISQLGKNQIVEKEIVFQIPSSYQGMIKALLIKDVDFNGTKRDIQIAF